MKGPHQSHDQPLVGVVVPIFRHSVLLVDAIESVLAQVAPFGIKIVLVNDGCPQKETDVVCRHFARTYPEQITYLRKPNGGLSDARNHGIRHILNMETRVTFIVANLGTVRASRIGKKRKFSIYTIR